VLGALLAAAVAPPERRGEAIGLYGLAIAVPNLIAVPAGVALVLAGHTHGGQLRVPGVGALVTNCDLPRRQARGVSSWVARTPDGAERRADLHVSAGLGTSPYTPVRFACRPEASLLTLTPSAAAA
jgi:predicted MPP superfamily phosphohydrolase